MENTQEIANEVRDIINWVAVFQKEYDLPEEVRSQLQQRLEKIASKLATQA